MPETKFYAAQIEKNIKFQHAVTIKMKKSELRRDALTWVPKRGANDIPFTAKEITVGAEIIYQWLIKDL